MLLFGFVSCTTFVGINKNLHIMSYPNRIRRNHTHLVYLLIICCEIFKWDIYIGWYKNCKTLKYFIVF